MTPLAVALSACMLCQSHVRLEEVEMLLAGGGTTAVAAGPRVLNLGVNNRPVMQGVTFRGVAQAGLGSRVQLYLIHANSDVLPQPLFATVDNNGRWELSLPVAPRKRGSQLSSTPSLLSGYLQEKRGGEWVRTAELAEVYFEYKK